jgi:hypothetical protein
MDIKNLSIIRQNFGNVVYTQKIHEICAEKQKKNDTNLNIIQIVITSLVLITLILQFILKKDWIGFIGAGLTITEIILLITGLSFSYKEKALEHKKIALELLSIREKYICLMTDILNEYLETQKIVERRDEILKQLDIIYKFAPQTTTESFKTAQNRLNPKGQVDGEDFTFSEEEIDRFLPKQLKLKNYNGRNDVR